MLVTSRVETKEVTTVIMTKEFTNNLQLPTLSISISQTLKQMLDESLALRNLKCLLKPTKDRAQTTKPETQIFTTNKIKKQTTILI